MKLLLRRALWVLITVVLAVCTFLLDFLFVYEFLIRDERAWAFSEIAALLIVSIVSFILWDTFECGNPKKETIER